MANRLDLHEEFIDILETKGESVSRVYFQPPSSVKLQYPCIVYHVGGFNTLHANDRNYKNTTRYTVTVIDANPDSDIPLSILTRFPMCSFDRAYPSDNLNHTVFTLYY